MNRSRAAITLAFVLSALAVPTAAHASVRAGTAGTYPFGINRAVFQNGRWAVTGTASGKGASNVIVRLYRGGKVTSTSRPKIGAKGAFKANFRIGRAGPVVVEVVRGAGGGAKASRARKFTVSVLDPSSRVGPTMRFLQSRLLALHYWPTLSGRYDARTRWAIRAYRKVNRMPRTFALNRNIIERVARGAGTLRLRYGATGRQRVEANLALQVYALIDAKGKIFHIVDTSSGRPAFPSDLGRFRFYLKRPGTLPDGMVNSVFYNGGEAVHGYASVPNYPWSHGCLRTPITYSLEIYRWLRLGDRIDVYGRAR
jgi:L,D-transpeptidase catalytic domain